VLLATATEAARLLIEAPAPCTILEGEFMATAGLGYWPVDGPKSRPTVHGRRQAARLRAAAKQKL
jgi:hypothetical protein